MISRSNLLNAAVLPDMCRATAFFAAAHNTPMQTKAKNERITVAPSETGPEQTATRIPNSAIQASRNRQRHRAAEASNRMDSIIAKRTRIPAIERNCPIRRQCGDSSGRCRTPDRERSCVGLPGDYRPVLERPALCQPAADGSVSAVAESELGVSELFDFQPALGAAPAPSLFGTVRLDEG